MKTQTCLGCDCEVSCQGDDKEDIMSYYCDRCGHYQAERLVLSLCAPNKTMKEKLQQRLIKTKNAHNRIITTKQKMKKVKKDEMSFIITIDESNTNTIELWKVEHVGGVSKISLDDEPS